MVQERPEAGSREPVSNNMSGGAENLVQAGIIAGGVFFGAQSNHDVEVVLQPEDHEVSLHADRTPKYVPVVIKSRLHDPQVLQLYVKGAPTNQWTVEPDEVTTQPGRPAAAKLRLVCTPTDPSAGPKELTVWAADAKGKSWRSNTVMIRVQSAPSLKVGEAVEPNTVTHGECAIDVSVRNAGNTHLAGKLGRFQPPSDDLSYLSPRCIKEIHKPHFELSPTQMVKVRIVVDLPPPSVAGQRLLLPLAVRLDSGDCSTPDFKVCIMQTGWISQIPGYMRQVYAWGGEKLGPYRRGSLFAGAAALFFVGMIFASIIAPAPASNAPADSGPLRSTTTTATAVSPSVASYDPMPCTPGMSIVFLASLKAQDARYGAFLVRSETKRLTKLDHRPKYTYVIHLSTRDGACKEALRDASPDSQAFLWTGPVPTSDASTVCADLGKTQRDDCHVDSMS